MLLTTVLASTNDNPNYYMFIPKQILFWGRLGIRFVAVFVGERLPEKLLAYSENIILWNKNLNLNTAYVAQNIRIYYPAILDIPDNEMVMITDMDMLPAKGDYFKNGLEKYTSKDFIYYRNIDGKQIYMCYNAAHPLTWMSVFGVTDANDIEIALYRDYVYNYNGIPGSTGWYNDQETMYRRLNSYPHLQVLQRPLCRLEVAAYKNHLARGDTNFVSAYDDIHFHRCFADNAALIADAERQL
jgi:hypothetical protein